MSMDPQRWQRVERLFSELLGLEGEELDRELDRRCGDDEALKEELTRLLGRSGRADAFLAGIAARAGIAPPEAESLLRASGQQVGRYRLLEQIGRGGMGVVYLAERADEAFDKRVAVKLLPLGLVTAEARARFERERRILARLEHPNIARLLDGGVTEEHTPYYVMEYVDGVPLDEYCRDRAPGLEQRLALFDAVCEAVAYAHRHLVIHRDIKPANILVTADGTPKLLDFGVAKLLDSETADTATVTGLDKRHVTPAFAAPELLTEAPVTTATDVYALGLVLYVLLADQTPFGASGQSPLQWVQALSTHDPPAPSTIADNPNRARQLRGDLDHIALKCTRNDPQQRYPSVDALRGDMARYADRLPVAARSATWRYRASRFVQRHRAALAVGAGVLVLLVAGLASTSYYAVKAAREADWARQQWTRAETVSGFLQGMFSAADPRVGGDMEAQVKGLLERADVGVEGEAAEDPQTRAQLLESYAVVTRSLGQLEKAEQAGRRALDLVVSAPASPEQRAAARVNLGQTLLLTGDTAEAQQMIEAAMAALPLNHEAEPTAFAARIAMLRLFAEDRAGPGPRLALLAELEPYEARIRALDQRTWMNFEQARLQTLLDVGDYERTLELGRGLADRVREQRGDDSPWLADSLSFVSSALFQLGRASEAEAVDRQMLVIYSKSLGADHAFTIGVYNQLATSLAQQGKYDEAIGYYRQAIDGWTAIHGEDYFYISGALTNLAQAQRMLGRLDEAVATMARAHCMDARLLGNEHPQAGMSQALLARLLGELGRLDEAEEQFEAGLEKIYAGWGTEHPVVLRIRAEHARFLIRLNRPWEALAILGEIQPGLVAAYGEDGIYPALASAYQGLAMLGLDRGEEAIGHLDAARHVLDNEESRRTRHQTLLREIDVAIGILKEKRAAEAARVGPQPR